MIILLNHCHFEPVEERQTIYDKRCTNQATTILPRSKPGSIKNVGNRIATLNN
jgi:hypothetical protein